MQGMEELSVGCALSLKAGLLYAPGPPGSWNNRAHGLARERRGSVVLVPGLISSWSPMERAVARLFVAPVKPYRQAVQATL